ncbi:U-box domain-containing protein 33-like [Bidens hawaiensis]|uniref:U-box domain-containing protein 33-like n=1 Tax=Bidens hawaiensis TaxID=980011 RepID=UPI00404AF50C
MKLLIPSHPSPTGTRSGFSSPATFRDGFRRNSPPASEIGGGDKVFVAVGKSVEKAVSLFHWTFRRFRDQEICILHVHQPSPLIPTLLGKLPATQANPDVASAYRREERDEMEKLLLEYMNLCSRSKVKAYVVTTENDQVRKGIMDLVNKYRVQKLVMGAAPENWMKVKKKSSKSSYAAKNAPPFCQIWLVNKGQLLFTREPAIDYDPPSSTHQDSSVLRTQSLRYPTIEREVQQVYHRSSSSTSFIPGSTSMTRSVQSNTSSESGYSSEHDLKVEEESLCKQLEGVNLEVEATKNEAFQELLKRKRLESHALEANNKVKAYESAHAQEVELRKASEDKLNAARQENEQLMEQKESTLKELHKLMTNIAILENQVHEANRRREESCEELKLIEASVATLKIEKLAVQRQRFEATNWLDRWKVRGQAGSVSCTTLRVTEFSLVDLETATCGFSESFKIGYESFGCSLYKGEMLNRTVMIKKLHTNNLQAQQEFQEEVQLVGKLQHKHILSLIGVCHEAQALVYVYTPTTLESHFSHKHNSISTSWKTRTRIISEIAKALLFLHGTRPEKLLHGNLSPENIVLDSELCSKLCNFRVSKLVNEETFRCRSFRQYSKPSSNGAFLFTDPDFLQTEDLTAKSDVYSFGMIILWLITGSRLAGLANQSSLMYYIVHKPQI